MSISFEYGVKVSLSAPIIVDGEGFGVFEGWALSRPDGPQLLTVCTVDWDPVTNTTVVGKELSRPSPFPRGNDPVRQAAARALWLQADLGITAERLRAVWYAEHPEPEIERPPPIPKPAAPPCNCALCIAEREALAAVKSRGAA